MPSVACHGVTDPWFDFPDCSRNRHAGRCPSIGLDTCSNFRLQWTPVSSALASEVVVVFQPIVDLRDLGVIGYEALARPRDGSSPAQLFAAARAQGTLGEVDLAGRSAAIEAAAAAGLGAPFALFLNAEADALELETPDLPHGSLTLILDVTEH